MNYQVLARKYRPQTFSDVIGQTHVTQTLKNAIKLGRVHHAYLFTGIRGVGKTTIARILAKAINCTSPVNHEPCNTCESCVEITQGRSMSVQEVDGASNTSVDDVREIRENVKYIPSTGGYKIYIIDEVHMLSTSAFNALLKTLEEPPDHVIFLFATTDPIKLPATILSRCQRYDLRRVGMTQIEDLLKILAEKEKIKIEPSALTVIAREADGSIRDAESLFDQAIAFAGDQITYNHLKTLLGFVDKTHIFSLLTAIFKRDSKSILELIDTTYQSGQNISRLAYDLLDQLHIFYLVMMGTDFKHLALPAEEADQFKALANLTEVSIVEQCHHVLFRASDVIAKSAFPKMIFETTLLKMSQIRAAQSVDELIARVESMARQIPAVSAAGGADRESRIPSADHTWDAFIEWMTQQRPQVVTILSQGVVSEFGEKNLTLTYPENSIYGEMLAEADRKADIEELLLTFFSRPLSLSVEFERMNSEKKSGYEVKKESRKDLVEEALQNSVVKDAVTIFNASIQDVKMERK